VVCGIKTILESYVIFLFVQTKYTVLTCKNVNDNQRQLVNGSQVKIDDRSVSNQQKQCTYDQNGENMEVLKNVGHTETEEQGRQVLEENLKKGEQLKEGNQQVSINGQRNSKVEETVDLKMSKYDQENLDAEKTVADEWKAWRAKYETTVQKHMKEKTWTNQIPGVKRETDHVQTTKHTKYTSKSTGYSAEDMTKDGKIMQNEEGKGLKKNSTNITNTMTSSKKSRPAKSKPDPQMTGGPTVGNKELFEQVLINQKQRKQNHLKMRPTSAFSYTSSAQTDKKMTKEANVKPEIVSNVDDSGKDPRQKLGDTVTSESELMRQIIDQQLLHNYTDGEWIHWIDDEDDGLVLLSQVNTVCTKCG